MPWGPMPIRPDDVPSLLRPGMTVFVQGASGEPTVLVEALRRAPERSAGVHYVQFGIPGINTSDLGALHETARLSTILPHRGLAGSAAARRLRALPLHYRDAWDHLAGLEFDLALIQVAPDDGTGRHALGVSIDFAPAVLPRARRVVAEVNRRMPAPAGGPSLDTTALHAAVESDRPLIAVPEPPPSATTAAIGRHVAGLIGDGDCLQIGLSSIGAAVLGAVEGVSGLRLHGGMIGDAAMTLDASGAVAERFDAEGGPPIVCGVALGSETLYRWAADSGRVAFRPVSETHDVRRLAAIDGLIAVNSALEVDLSGQANAEMLGGQRVSGTGGLLDFMRGARRSRGGRAVLALAATAAGGRVSRIVPRLGPVTCPAADVDVVVTEHGVAALRGLPPEERAAALIAVAAPAHREALAAAWRDGP